MALGAASRALFQAKRAQQELGQGVRKMLKGRGIVSVAAEGFQVTVAFTMLLLLLLLMLPPPPPQIQILLQAPSVVVSYTSNPDIKTGKVFAEIGVQIAAGVPLQVNRTSITSFVSTTQMPFLSGRRRRCLLLLSHRIIWSALFSLTTQFRLY